MFNVLRFIVIVVTALVVFGWSLVAADETNFFSVMVSTSREKKSEADVKPSLAERKPQARMQAQTRHRSRQATYRKPKIDLTPEFSRPDFGATPPLVRKSVTVADFDGMFGRPSVPHRDWLSEQGLLSPSPELHFVADVAIPQFTNSAPAAMLAFVDVVETEVEEAQTIASQPKQPTQSKSVSLRPAGLNHRALREKIDAYNLSVAAIEEQIRSQDRWDMEGVELVVEQVGQVIADRSLWSMYLALLEPSKRRRIGRVSSLDESLNALRERIFEVRVETDVNDKTSYISKTKTKQRLEALDQQVQDLLQE